MTELALAAVSPVYLKRIDRLRHAVDLPKLIARGWDPERRVFAPKAVDPIFGWSVCDRVGCERSTSRSDARQAGLCEPCLSNFKDRQSKARGITLAQFKATPYRATVRVVTDATRLCRVCRVPGHERRARRTELCLACSNLQRDRGQTVDDYVNGDDRFPAAAPRPTLPDCEVADCVDHREMPVAGLCRGCYKRWCYHEQPDLDAFKAAGLPRFELDAREVALPPLPELVELQVLVGLQRFMHLELHIGCDELRRIGHELERLDVEDLLALPKDWGPTRHYRRFVRVLREAAEIADTDAETELRQDVWRLRVLYPHQRHRDAVISFTHVHQPWLRDLTKAWCAHQIGALAEGTVGGRAVCTRNLSTFLGTLPHRGEIPGLLTREDLDRYVAWEHAREPTQAYRTLGHLRELLRFARRKSHTAPGGLAAGLPAEFVLLREDTKPRRGSKRSTTEDYEPGRALPDYVLAQLLEPDTLMAFPASVTNRRAFELLAHTGRRPIEVLDLRGDCLRYVERLGPDGVRRRPVMRYRRSKPPAKWLELPIHEETAEIIRAQQREVQQRFPGRPLSKLKLFARSTQNASGLHCLSSSTFATMLKRWVRLLPPLVDEEGNEVSKDGVYPYALRHSYAQRHADNNTPLDVLQELMDHRSPQTTQIYYRVKSERLHEAIRAATPLTVNRAGDRVGGGDYPDAERLSRSIGQIPVPLGYCVEPHNVKALGSSCPFSHQCLGCEHYRTDPSYLPDLYAYLEQLLDAQERLRAAVPELAEWARAKALPNDAEVVAVRNLIRASEDLLADLPDADRRKLEELFRALRGSRAKTDQRLPIEYVAAVAQPAPTFSPPMFEPLTPRAGNVT